MGEVVETNKKKSISELAAEELRIEISRDAVGKIKSKMRELHKAKQIVTNLERELIDLNEEVQGQLDELK